MAVCAAGRQGYSARSVVLPIVPMFHVNAWGIPYSAPLVGAKLVFPGAGLDGKSLYELFESEGVESLRRRADRVARPDPVHEAEQSQVLDVRGRRRSAASACPAAMIRTLARRFRRQRRARLGHDRDEPGRHDRTRPKAKHAQSVGRRALRAVAEAGPAAVRRRDEDRRCRRSRAAARRRRDRRRDGQGPVGDARLLQERRQRARCRPTAGSRPATSARSTPTAICRSPTARRT